MKRIVLLAFLVVSFSQVITGCINQLASDSGLLLVQSNVNGDLDIFLVDSTSGETTTLIGGNLDQTDARWSPDGEKVLYTSTTSDQNLDLFLLDLESGNTQQLTQYDGVDRGGRWAPEGNRIAFISDRSGAESIHVLNLVTGEITDASQSITSVRSPAWSPDGRWIAYAEADANGGNWFLHIASADETGKRRVHDLETSSDMSPHWSSDGNRIVYAATRRRNSTIYVYEVASGIEERLTNEMSADIEPYWSPDGEHILFLSARDPVPQFHVYVMNADGSDQHNLTNSQVADARFSPDGSKIVYTQPTRVGVQTFIMSSTGQDARSVSELGGVHLRPLLRP